MTYTIRERAFEDALDNATYAVLEAFGTQLSHKNEEELSDLLVAINDALSVVMYPATTAANESE
jgi:hypothetical protein